MEKQRETISDSPSGEANGEAAESPFVDTTDTGGWSALTIALMALRQVNQDARLNAATQIDICLRVTLQLKLSLARNTFVLIFGLKERGNTYILIWISWCEQCFFFFPSASIQDHAAREYCGG